MRDAGKFEVELETSDAFGGSAEFEVHVAEVILAADDVGKRGVALEVVAIKLGDESDGDATDGANERHTGIHEGEHAGTDTGHRGGSVGFHDFTDNAEGVRKIRLAWDDGLDRTLGKGTVTDLAAVHSTEAAGFADAEGREIVMEHEALGVRATAIGIDHLGLIGGSESRDAEGLGFATGEDRAAVGAGQQADLAGEGANFVESTAIAALLAVEDRNAEGFFLQVVEGLGDFEFRSGREFFEHGFFDFLAECADGFRAVHFAAGVERGLDAITGDRVGDF